MQERIPVSDGIWFDILRKILLNLGSPCTEEKGVEHSMAKQPRLSIGMIVKNEIRSIEKCLKALQPLRDAIPCELVIADTGSTDGTRELVMQYADVFFDFKWVNDFSAARNAVMDRCSGEWYLTVDADEYLDPNVSEFSKLLSGGIDPGVDACTVIQRNYTDALDCTCYNDFYALRMVRMATGARYQNPIHETFGLEDQPLTITMLDHVILWHDGYLEHKGQRIIAKQKRNLMLLEEQLRETPDDLRLLMQAADSAYTPEQECSYAKKLAEIIEAGKTNKRDQVAPAWQRVLKIAHKQKMWEFVIWHERAKQMVPDSFFTRVDGNYYAVEAAWNRRDYAAVIEHGTAYLEGIRALGNAAPKQKTELLYGSLCKEKDKNRVSTELTMACAYAELCRWKECREILKCYPAKDLRERDLSLWLHAAGICAAGQNDADMWKKFADGMARVEDWNEVSYIVVKLLLENNLPLPDSFFAQSTNRLIELADALGDEFRENFPKVLMDRTAQDGNDDDPKVVLWNHTLLSAALAAADWGSDDEEILQWLIDTYAVLTSVVLNFYYNPEILREETVTLLPDMHHFGWCFLQGCAAKEEGDVLAYVRWLHKALKAAPTLKEMIEYLLEDVNRALEQTKMEREETAETSELLELAAQIRAVMAQYAPDDPAVVALKQTPAYQAVAHLIESAV